MASPDNTINLLSCSLNLGEMHNNVDPGFYKPVFHFLAPDGQEVVARMRLHVTEPLNSLMFADPRFFKDGGLEVNSSGSPVFTRRSSYAEIISQNKGINWSLLPTNTSVYSITADHIKSAVLQGFQQPTTSTGEGRLSEVAFTCHDPSIIGGGNIILFRLINWLSELGTKVTVYSCGSLPSWTMVNARFRCFRSYEEMFPAIQESVVILYSMWHIEPMLKTKPFRKKIYHLRQIVEDYHFGSDYQSMIARKPVIELLESLPIGSIAISPHIQDWYQRELGISSQLISNGINHRNYYPASPKTDIPSVVRVVSVGDPTHFVKGADVLKGALLQLASRHPELRFRWHIAAGQERKLPQGWLGQVKNLELVTHFSLNAAQMRELYQNADVFINPSLYEGFGLPTLEAMACGAPVVQANNSGLDFIIRHNVDCLVIPINNPGAIASAVEQLLCNPNLSRQLVENGFKTANNYSIANQFNQFVTAFEEILNTKFDLGRATNIRRRLDPIFSMTRNEPLVSVVIPSYNQAEYLREALDSLLAQTYHNWEAVVVNDGSKDHTNEVMEEYARRDSRIRPFSKPNGGITSALNFGLEQARGEFFCWLSSDDLFYPEKIEAQVKAFAELEDSYALVYGSFDLLLDEEKRIDIQPYAEPLTLGAEFPEALKFDFIDGCTIMIRMDVMRQIGGFNPYYLHSQDMELWIRIASFGYRFFLLNKKLTIRRIHLAQSSTGNMIHCRYDAAWMIDYYLDHFQLLELYRYFDLSKEPDIDRFVTHFTSRMLHTEANINHPLLQEKFWHWFDNGIRALQPEMQKNILRLCSVQLFRFRSVSHKLDYFIDACLDSLNQDRIWQPMEQDFSSVGRYIRFDNRENDPFGKKLFDYATDLLVNKNTPLFAQELYFHNTNKVVDTPYKLAHSAIRYLSQFPNQFRDRVRPHSDISQIPNSTSDAITLFCRLKFPEAAEAFIRSYEVLSNRSATLTEVALSDVEIAGHAGKYAEELYLECAKHPTEAILFYWDALVWAASGNFAEALKQGWKAIPWIIETGTPWMAYRIGEWATHQKEINKAWIAFHMASGSRSDEPSLKNHLRKISLEHLAIDHDLPKPKSFIFKKTFGNYTEAPVRGAIVVPHLNGNYTLHITVQKQDGCTSTVSGILPYKESFTAIKVPDPETGKEMKFTAEALFNLWTKNYDFHAESENYFQELLTGQVKPAVAFTMLNSSIQGGGPSIIFRYANWLTDLGVPVTIYSNDAPPSWIEIKAKFQAIPEDENRYATIKESIIIVYSVLEIPSLLQNVELHAKRIFHICQGVEDFNYYGADYSSLISPKPIFELLHSIPVGRLAVSGHIQDYFENQYQQNTYTIPNGIDLTVFKPGWKHLISDNINILIVGNPKRLLKGAGDAKQALYLLAQRHPEWNLNLTIVSGDRVINDENLNSGFLGYSTTIYWGLSQIEMRETYQAADVFVNPAWYEGFGLPSLEAMACGVPVIQANNQGLDGIIKDGENCLVIPPQNPQEMADAIEEVILDSRLRQKLIDGGICTAREHSVTQQFSAFVNAFEKILVTQFNPIQIRAKKFELEKGKLEKRMSWEIQRWQPKFSIIIPTYNQAKFLPAALESLLNQTYPNWEAIIVNDGSTDDTPLIMEQYAARDIRFRIYHKENGGAASALNEGLRYAQGEWICWLSSDDLFEPEKLAIHVNAIQKFPEIKFFHTHYYFLDEGTGVKSSPSPDLHLCMPTGELQVLRFFQSNYISGNSITIHHSVFDQVGFFNEELRFGQDFDMWLRISAIFQSLFLNVRTCTTRLHPQQDSSRFPEAGKLDSAISCLNFLNTNEFSRLFPLLDLSKLENCLFAVKATMEVAMNPQAFINICGFSPALLNRLAEWIGTACSPEHQNTILNLISQRVSRRNQQDIPGGIQRSMITILGARENIVNYQVVEPIASLQEKIIEFQARGNLKDAAILRRYLDRFDPNFKLEKGQTNQENKIVDDPLISVIIPTFNRPQNLLVALNSVAKQTYSNIEIIVVNDCGEDVNKVIDRYQGHFKIRVEKHSKNRGAGAARNTGISLARGEYIAFLDDDDNYLPHHIETLVKAIEENPQVSAVYSDAVQVTIDTRKRKPSLIDKRVVFSRNFSIDNLLVSNYIPILCLLVRKNAIDIAGEFSEEMSALEDWEWLIRMAQTGPFLHQPIVTAEYVVRVAEKTRNILKPEQIEQIYQNIYANYKEVSSPDVQAAQRKLYASIAGHELVQVDRENPPVKLEKHSPEEVLSTLLDSDDLLASINEHKESLNMEFVELVRKNAEQASAEGNDELSQGLLDLAEYVDNLIP